jgi:hypothetical protein
LPFHGTMNIMKEKQIYIPPAAFILTLTIVLATFVVMAIVYFYKDGMWQSVPDDTIPVKSSGVVTVSNCIGEECLQAGVKYPVGKLSKDARLALIQAADEQYKLQIIYGQVIEKYGRINPFITILRSKEQFMLVIISLFDKYGLDVPKNPYVNEEFVIGESIRKSCLFLEETEKKSQKLFEEDLLTLAEDYDDITIVFRSVVNTSRNSHITHLNGCK